MLKESEVFKFGGSISKRESTIIGIVGAVLLFLLWYGVTYSGEIINPKILPNPIKVLKSIPI